MPNLSQNRLNQFKACEEVRDFEGGIIGRVGAARAIELD
jgi:hypothetical protein